MFFPGCFSVRHRKQILLLCLAFLLPGLSGWAAAGTVPDVIQLQQQAERLQLQDQRYWQVLLHYRKAGAGWESQIDDPDFFFAKSGKTNPKAELDATIAALFGRGADEAANPRCRFVARKAWLQKQLGLVEAGATADECPEFATALRRVDPQSATLVFPGSYANSPASMFGHTLLNLHGPYQSKQLAFAANYSAYTDETNGFAYALKGITGGYRGYFSLLPYYDKIKEYSGLERRDIWEYPLRLTPDETRKMFLHLWELRDIYSDYYFFAENCSYNLLFLLEAARPDLHLTDRRPLWTLPVDTVRLLDRCHLIAGADYRPSVATVLNRQAAALDGRETELARNLAAGKLNGADLDGIDLGIEAKRRVLETAATAVELKFLKQELALGDYRPRYLDILQARSRLGSEGAPSAEPDPVRPDRGHGGARLSLGTGYREFDWVEEVSFRPANHGLLDPEEGYLDGSQIELGSVALTYQADENRLRLQRLTLVDIVSLSPVNAFDAPISWLVKVGVRRQELPVGWRPVVHLGTGGGYAWQVGPGLGYLMLETEGLFQHRLKHNLAVGGGASAGYLTSLGSRWRLHARVRQVHYLVGETDRSESADLGLSLRLDRQNSLMLETGRRSDFGRWSTGGMLFWHHYW